MEKIPRVGVGVVIKKDNKILLGKRKNAHGAGTWCPPGGHLEFMETIEDCARREVEEEVDLEIKNLKKVSFTEDLFKEEKKHYVTILVEADWAAGEVKLCEPDKCTEWRWFCWNELPEELFLPLKNHIKQDYKPF